MRTPIIVKLSSFSGVAQGLFYGASQGRVFFSPAMETAAANSVIQIEEVDVCTKAYDTYKFPALVDPVPLFTYPLNPGVTFSPSLLGAGSVLWAKASRLSEATFDFGYENPDTYGGATSSRAIATISEPIDPTKVSLLNNVYWTLFDGIGHPFITAANLSPIGPGSTTVVTLEP